MYCTGTACSNTLGLHPYVKNPPKKAPRGTHQIFQDQNNPNLTCAIWFDTKPVRFILTETDPRIVGSTLRRVQGKYERLNQPLIVQHYNSHFKSVNVFDFLSSKYYLAHWSSRHYLFNFCMQAAIVNAFILYMGHNTEPRNKTYSQWEFRLALGKKLIGCFSVRKTLPRVEPLFVGPDNTSKTFINHQNTRMPNIHSRTCKTHMTNFGKKQRTVYGCLSCNIHLCKD